jgi:hypothetical protein
MIKDLFISANLIMTIESCEKILVLLEDNVFFLYGGTKPLLYCSN